MGFSFDIEYRLGLENKVANTLSRIEHVVELLALTFLCALQLEEIDAQVSANLGLSQL